MIDTTRKSAASSKSAGYSPSSTDLPLAWLNYCDHPESPETKNILAIHLDSILKERLPDNRYEGILSGREEEVRQEACLLVVSKYLAGNPELIAATASVNHQEIDAQIRRSVGAAIKSASQTLKHAIKRHRQLHSYGEDLDALPQAVCTHPACRTSLWELPYEAQRQMVFAALRSALKKKLLHARNARILMDMIKEGLSQSEIAKRLGISRAAVHQRLEPVRKIVKKHIDSQEFLGS